LNTIETYGKETNPDSGENEEGVGAPFQADGTFAFEAVVFVAHLAGRAMVGRAMYMEFEKSNAQKEA